MSRGFLRALAAAAQLLSVLPLAVLCEGAGYGSFTWWHFLLLYAAFAAFYGCGRLAAAWALGRSHKREYRAPVAFFSKLAIALPIAAFITVCTAAGFSTALYLYALPAAVVMYYGGYISYGKEYSDIFTRGWFALYFVLALAAAIIVGLTRNAELTAAADLQLCGGFGVLIVISAILTNQTNIDICTHQRDAGRSVLPRGLRRYNCLLSAAVAAGVCALLLLAVPLGQLFGSALKQLITLIVRFLQGLGNGSEATDAALSGTDSAAASVGIADNYIADALSALMFVGIAVLLFALRKHIADLFRQLFAPLFKAKATEEPLAYTDELSEAARGGGIPRRKRAQQLYRLYRRETDPAEKYRLGYRFMLLRLSFTQYPPCPADNTYIHREKGEIGLQTDKMRRIVEIYNRLRYGGQIPTEEEIRFEEAFIEEIRR